MEGQGENSLVVGSAEKRFIQKNQLGSRTWTSIIEFISTKGKALRQLIIFRGKSVQQQWFKVKLNEYKDWHFDATENGWTSNATALEGLKKVFIPQTRPRDPDEP